MDFLRSPVLLYFAGYGLFTLLLFVTSARSANRLFDKNGFVSGPLLLLKLHIIGIILFGIVPLLAHPPARIGISGILSLENLPLWITSILVLSIIILSAYPVEKDVRDLTQRTGINLTWDPNYIPVYFIIRILFICAYEWWFRGHLLFDCIRNFGVPVSVLINVILYSLLHLVNGKKEMIACIPFGLLLCCMCIWADAAWPAIAIHLALTVSYEGRFLQKLKKIKSAAHEDFNNGSIRLYRK